MRYHLLLIRHAKSSWRDASLDDFDRPLNKRGRRDGERVGRVLAGELPLPELILCSPTRRTRDTLAMLQTALNPEGTATVRFEPGIYHASANGLLEALASSDAANCVALIGHEPGLGELVEGLCDDLPEPLGKFPTLGIAWLSCAVPPARMTLGCAHLEAMYRPRMIAEGAASGA